MTSLQAGFEYVAKLNNKKTTFVVDCLFTIDIRWQFKNFLSLLYTKSNDDAQVKYK